MDATRCDTCRHARPLAENGSDEQGYQCRRFPPQVVAFHVPPKIQGQAPGVQITPVFPQMPAGESCGEWGAKHDA